MSGGRSRGGPRDEPPADDSRGGLESLLDAQTHSAESFAAGRGLVQGDLAPPPNEATDFGLERAVQQLAQQLETEGVSPATADILGAVQPRTSAAPGSGRVVSAPPGPLVRPESPPSGVPMASSPGASVVSPTGAELLRPGPGESIRHARAVDTGPIDGEPFAAGSTSRPMPAGQSQIGLGAASGPYASDFYGRDTPVPDPTRADPATGLGQTPGEADPQLTPAEVSHHDSALWAMRAPTEVEIHPSHDGGAAAQGDGDTERAARRTRRAPGNSSPAAFILASLVLGTIAMIVVLRVLQ